MIKELIIENFQSHNKTIINFNKGVNCILGKSDSGKTAIIRAINWVVNNAPSGDAFRSKWGGDTKIKLKLKDKGEILRYKTKEVPNGYQLNYPLKTKKKNGKASETFKAFGQGVPKEIKEYLNIDFINIQQQFDTPFLLSENVGEVARILNKLIHLEKVDIAISNINKILKQERGDLVVQKEVIEEGEKELKKLNWLPEAEGRLNKLEVLNKKIKQDEKKINQLSELLQEYSSIKRELKEYTNLKDLQEEWLKHSLQSELIIKKELNMLQLEKLINEVEEAEEDIKIIEKEIFIMEDEFNNLIPKGSECPLCGEIIK